MFYVRTLKMNLFLFQMSFSARPSYPGLEYTNFIFRRGSKPPPHPKGMSWV